MDVLIVRSSMRWYCLHYNEPPMSCCKIFDCLIKFIGDLRQIWRFTNGVLVSSAKKRSIATTLLKTILLKVVINTYKPSIIIPLSIHRSTNNIIIGEYEKLFIVVMEYSIHIKVQLIIFQPPRYSWNIVESGVKYHKLNQNLIIFLCVVSNSRGSTKRNRTILFLQYVWVCVFFNSWSTAHGRDTVNIPI
jgi:hypothetical protein